MKLSDLFGTAGIPIAKLRREIFALGGRHMGDPLAGALSELQDEGLSPERRTLLRAVVSHLAPGRAGPPSPAGPPRLADAFHLAIIVGAAAVGWVLVRGL